MTKEEKLEELGTFYILNAEVMIDTRLTDFEKILYSLINGLSKGKDGCYASDEYFGTILDKSEATIGRALKKLESLKYIFRFTENKGEKRGSSRKIFTQETIKNRGLSTIKNECFRQSKMKKKTIKNDCSLINKLINNNNNDFELSEIEKIQNRILSIAKTQKYNLYKISQEVYKFKNRQDLLNLEKRVINGELKF